MSENVCEICKDQMEMRFFDSVRWFWFCWNCDHDGDED